MQKLNNRYQEFISKDKKLDFNFEVGAILNIDKPAGLTSFQVVKKIRKHFNIRKVGHAGTLDPSATGVLLILTGKATKNSISLTGLEKEYLAEIELGIETDTDDIEGKIISRSSIENEYNGENIQNILNQFVGEIDQIPPVYSAIKFQGKPLYKYARQGINVDLKPRKIRIDNISLIDLQWPVFSINVRCSKGTYIRALARDFGKKLGTGAYLKSLIRTRIGPYRVEEALNLNDFLQMGAI